MAITECADWLIEHVDAQIKAYGIRIYRQDFNFDPLPYWLDAPADRLGITENLHIQNYLRFWDELRLRNPDLIIDSCASGGRRNDYEAMRRSVALHFTDYGYHDRMKLFGVNVPCRQNYRTSKEAVRMLKESGLWVSIWFVNDPENGVYYREAGADAIVTASAAGTVPAP